MLGTGVLDALEFKSDSSIKCGYMKTLKDYLWTFAVKGIQELSSARSLWTIPLIALILSLTGCQPTDGLNRQPIHGRVMLGDEPLNAGSLLLEPISKSAGTAVGAAIENGQFSITRDKGPVPGTYRVRIYASSNTQAPARAGDSPKTPRPMLERVPARYNAESDLEAEVLTEGTPALNFNLQPDAPTDSAAPVAPRA